MYLNPRVILVAAVFLSAEAETFVPLTRQRSDEAFEARIKAMFEIYVETEADERRARGFAMGIERAARYPTPPVQRGAHNHTRSRL